MSSSNNSSSSQEHPAGEEEDEGRYVILIPLNEGGHAMAMANHMLLADSDDADDDNDDYHYADGDEDSHGDDDGNGDSDSHSDADDDSDDDSDDEEGSWGSSISGDDDDYDNNNNCNDDNNNDNDDGGISDLLSEMQTGKTLFENRLCKRTRWRKLDSRGRLVCSLCNRRFRSVQHIQRHEESSEVHDGNVEERFASEQAELDAVRKFNIAALRHQVNQRRQDQCANPPERKKPRMALPETGMIPNQAYIIEDRTSVPSLDIDIIARIASFTGFLTGLMDICIAVGPKDATVIRHYNLHDNYRFLQRNVILYVSEMNDSDPCSENIKTWMEANTDWKKLCTPDNIDKFSRVTMQDEDTGVFTSNVDPKALFNNPAVAIELGLDKVLKHLIQQDGFDVNQYKYGCYAEGLPTNLVALSLYGQRKSLSLLLSVEDINLNLHVYDPEEYPTSNKLFTCACTSDPSCFRLLVNSHRFKVNQQLSGPLSPLPLHVLLKSLLADCDGEGPELHFWRQRFHYLLRAGADPRISVGSVVSPIEQAREWRNHYHQLMPSVHRCLFWELHKAIELMERLAKMLDEG